MRFISQKAIDGIEGLQVNAKKMKVFAIF